MQKCYLPPKLEGMCSADEGGLANMQGTSPESRGSPKSKNTRAEAYLKAVAVTRGHHDIILYLKEMIREGTVPSRSSYLRR